MMRRVARALIGLFRLHGRSRWSNEFIQALDPAITQQIPNRPVDASIWFRTGHGRLFWRVRETPYEEPETTAWISTFSKDDVFLDVGANMGLFSILAAKTKGVKVIAIEPDLMNARLLYENVIKNGVSLQVAILPIALSSNSHIGELHLKTLSYGDALHSLDGPSAYVDCAEGGIAKIPAFSFENLATSLALPRPNKVKIDVDGHEIRILEGFGEYLDAVDEMMIEVDPDKTTYPEVQKVMALHGFTLVNKGSPTVEWNSMVNYFYKRV